MKVQNKKGIGIFNKLFMLAAVLILIGQMSITANAQGTTKVKAESAKIRSSASTSSEVKASVVKNDKLDVLAQTTDSNGYTWYKVYVNGSDTGYIRADLVAEVEGSVKTESASNTSESSAPSTNEGQAVEFVQVEESTVTGAKVTAGSVNVRSNPSTGASVAGKAKEGMEVTVTGEAADADGKTWYQVSFNADGKDVEGFIRSDFLEVTANAEPEPVEEPVEEEPAEEEETEISVNKEYELVYEANPEGVEEWFLYDHNRGTKQSLADLLSVVRQTQDNENSATKQLKTFKILVIVMVAVILALIIGITLLIFKLRDSYEYEYEDDDDEDDDDDDIDDDIDDDEDDEDDEDEEEVVERKPVFKKTAKTSQSARAQTASAKSEQPAPKKESSSWQSKNFLDIDDDMEFEFLDIK